MNIYLIQKINKIIKIRFVKNFIVWILHIFNKRYLAIYFDPVLACNLRCKSCYFSNEEKRKELKGVFKADELNQIAKAVFSRALRLQIGCGAEPTLFQHNPELIRLAKKHKVSYISLTTNANLLTPESTKNLLDAGLDELTISLHGVTKETYENLMTNASFDKLLEVLQILTDLKPNYPAFKLRLNYTINNRNIAELKTFFDVLGKYKIDILQLRSLRDIGGEIQSVDRNNEFNIELKNAILSLKNECRSKKIAFIEPDSFSVDNLESNDDDNASYCYISPRTFWQPDFDWKNETYNEYSKRTKYASKLFRKIFA